LVLSFFFSRAGLRIHLNDAARAWIGSAAAEIFRPQN
jgi:hypothetical protein